jgi:hypothetical protein
MPVAAGMIAVLNLITMFTVIDVSAKGFCATLFDSSHCLLVAWQHLRSVLLAVGWPILFEYIGQFYHLTPQLKGVIQPLDR